MAKRTICFTGHRPAQLYGYGCSAWRDNEALKIRIADELEALVEADGGEFSRYDFITGGAQGADQLCFWAVEQLKDALRAARPAITVRNVVYIPFEGQEDKWHESGSFSQREYRAMLERADEVRNVSGITRDSLGSRHRGNVVGAYFARNHAMVDASDLLVCIWNKPFIPGNGSGGGTDECVVYAMGRDHEVLVIDVSRSSTYRLSHNVLLGEEDCDEPRRDKGPDPATARGNPRIGNRLRAARRCPRPRPIPRSEL